MNEKGAKESNNSAEGIRRKRLKQWKRREVKERITVSQDRHDFDFGIDEWKSD